jgi:Spy/CpxP family protein refolding chaperone
VSAPNDPLRRARLLGVALVALAYAAGVATGLAVPRRPREGMTVVVTDAIPRELARLGLSDAQRERIRAILARGRPRMSAVMRELEPRLRAAFDSTDREVAEVLTPAQRAALAESRRREPPIRREIIRRP